MRQAKSYIAVFLLFLTFFRMLVIPLVYLDFELNKDYIIKNLCENRFKPELECNGQCYLAKKLNQTAENNAKNEAERQGQNLRKIISETFNYEIFNFENVASFAIHLNAIFTYTSHYSSEFRTSLFHPPTV